MFFKELMIFAIFFRNQRNEGESMPWEKKGKLFAFAAIGLDVWTETGSGKGKAIEYVITKFYPVIGILGFISYREGYTEGRGLLSLKEKIG